MFDSTTNECKLFAGSLNDLKSVCRAFGYQREPNYETCDAVFEPESAKGCYSFRQGYCRFEFEPFDQLDDIRNLNDCQSACEYTRNCKYFMYDVQEKTCSL